MAEYSFEAMPLEDWKETRDTIQLYSQVLGAVRHAFAPKEKFWSHISLRADVEGLTTTVMPAGKAAPSLAFKMTLNLIKHKLIISDSRGETRETGLSGHSVHSFCKDALGSLNGLGIEPEIDRSQFGDETHRTYDPVAAERFWRTLSQVDLIFKDFKSTMHHETSPVQLWPHHFDLAFLWFSGQSIPGEDPADLETSSEQMNFGFVTGDELIPEPYFYITVHPVHERMPGVALPDGVSWHNEGWQGALMKYDTLVKSPNPGEKLRDFLRQVFTKVGSFLMEF